MKTVLSSILCAILALITALSIYMIVSYYVGEKEALDNCADLQELVVRNETEKNVEPNGEPSEITELSVVEEIGNCPITVDFAELQSEYPNVVGWLYCEGTPINYPVMQSKDNNYYLRRLPDGSYNIAGSLFADYRCGGIGEANNYIIYGHNMKNGTMFNSLTKYKSQDYYNEHSVMYFLTPECNYMLDLVAGLICKSTGDVYNTELSVEMVRNFCIHSTFIGCREFSNSDQFITLSTCSYEYENARYVVIGLISEI